MVGIHGEYGNTQLLHIYLHIDDSTTKNKIKIYVLNSLISLFEHRD
jgi:hypothetical protein